MQNSRLLLGLGTFLTLLCSLVLAPLGGAFPLPQEVRSPLQRLYIPGDYDDNDNIELIVFGYFPHSCFKTGRTHHEINLQEKSVNVIAISFLYDEADEYCVKMKVPFAQRIQLGILPPGEYKIRIAGSSVLESQLIVKQHTSSSPDDYLYAPVDNMLVEKEEPGAPPHRRAILRGRFPQLEAGCMRIRNIDVRREQQNIVVLRPIAEVVGNDLCKENAKRDFEIEVALPQDITNKTLVHVRVMNGESLNKIYLDL